MNNLCLLTLVTLAGAYSYTQWLFRLIFNKRRLKKMDRLRITKPFFKNVGKNTIEALDLAAKYGGYHDIKNIGTALGEDDPQAMYKFYSFVITIQGFVIVTLITLWSVL